MFDVQVIGIKFTSLGEYGDFAWMCHQSKYANSLFIFNDNEEYHGTDLAGSGNAIMRMFNKYAENIEKPLSAGVPTGTISSGGYNKYTPKVKKTIDEAFEEIIELIEIHRYHTIYFSAELDGKMGTSIFAVDQQVIEYITSRIYNLSTHPVQIVKTIPNNSFDDELTFEDYKVLEWVG